MASITSVSFDQPVYNPGDTITATMDYVPDSPSVVPTTYNFTGTLTNQASGAVVATSAPAPFVVNVSQPAGDEPGGSDDGGHTWAVESDTGSVAELTTTA